MYRRIRDFLLGAIAAASFGAMVAQANIVNPFDSAAFGALYCKLTGGANCTMGGDILFSPDASFDIGKTGATRPRDGFFSRNITIGGTFVSSNSIFAGASSTIGFNGRSALQSSTDGILTLFNSGGTDFTRQNYGGNTSSFPAWSRNGDALEARLADNSASTITISRYFRSISTTGTPVFSQYPAAATAGAGSFGYISDSTTIVSGATVTGGGANKIIMWSDGTNWKVMGI